MYKYKLIAIEARRVEDNHKRLHRNAFPKIKKYHIEIKSVCLFVLRHKYIYTFIYLTITIPYHYHFIEIRNPFDAMTNHKY